MFNGNLQTIATLRYMSSESCFKIHPGVCSSALNW
nr:MAG TPA: hypothetical protein [Caudoviricetes sp.]